MLKINIQDIIFDIEHKLDKNRYLIFTNKKLIGSLRYSPILFFQPLDFTYSDIIENNFSYVIKNILNIDRFFCFNFKNEYLISFKEIDKIKQGIVNLIDNIYNDELEIALFNNELNYYYLKRKNETYENMIKNFFHNVKCNNSSVFVDILKDSGYHEIYKIAKKIKYELML